MEGLYPDVEPSGNDSSVDDGRHQHTPIEAWSAGQEALEAVDGREADLGIVEGQKLVVHGAPAAARGAVLPGVGVLCGACVELRSEARLCGPASSCVPSFGADGSSFGLGFALPRLNAASPGSAASRCLRAVSIPIPKLIWRKPMASPCCS